MLRLILSFCIACLSASALSADDYSPKIADASNDAKLALQGFVIPDGMHGSLLAAEPQLANPVAFHVAPDGRVFVCETFRQEAGVEDNRSHMDWLLNDLRLQTVEERLAMFKKYLGSDVAKYGTQHDRIRVLTDSDGDGTLDRSTVFAQGFNNILDGTGAGVLEHNGRVYYTCIPKLWMLEDTDGDLVADLHEPLHHGYGVRVAFRGHDMHGLMMGPDGRLYFSIGDRGYNVITQEGTRLHRPDTGAVFRCDVDGSHLEVFSYGLRNPQELAFDDHGNLFTVDNNSDSGDQARLVYVVQDGDSGWRMYFQYLDDRGPWNRERMWYPYRADPETTAVQPGAIVPPIANMSDGPSGLTYYPGLGLSERYQNHFFLADFRGTAGTSGIRSFTVSNTGATFELQDSHEFIWSILATDVDFAPDGSLYVSDWVNGWVGEGKGRLYRFVDEQNISAVSGANVPGLLAGGVTKATTDELFTFLSHPDRRVRQQAQFELADRKVENELLATAQLPGDELTHRHVAWALWQTGLQSAETAATIVTAIPKLLRQSDDAAVQYLRILADLIDRHGRSIFASDRVRDEVRDVVVGLTASEDMQIAGFAAAALGRTGRSGDAVPLVSLLDRNNGTDPVVRHQAVMGLTHLVRRSPTALQPFFRHRNPAVRTALTLACSRADQGRAVISMLGDQSADVQLQAARLLLDERFGIGEEEVFALWNQKPGSPDLLRRCLEAAYRLGRAECAEAVAHTAARRDLSEDIRVLAAGMLKSWNDPQQTDTVNGRWRPLPQRDVSGLAEAVRPYLPGLLAGPKPVRETAVAVAADLGIRDIVPTLEQMLADMATDETSRVAAFRALSTLTTDTGRLVDLGRQDSSEAIRIAALELLAEHDPAAAVPSLAEVLKSGSVRAQQNAVRLLGGIRNKAAGEALQAAFRMLRQEKLPTAVTLDLLQAAVQHGDSALQNLVAEFRADQKAVGTRLAEWSECLEGGDAERGRTVFFGRAAASCRRCHKVNGDGAEVGPDLSAIAKDKDRSYLLEAIVDPNAKIARGFETTIIVDIDGRIHSGIIKEETEQFVRLMTPQGALITVATEEIDERAKGQSGMPSDITKALSRDDVRDLVEYLAGLKIAADGSHGKTQEE
ncbi:MAG: PQQ-dependent sugar dehydrogenase [Fuerstiella sp.]